MTGEISLRGRVTPVGALLKSIPLSNYIFKVHWRELASANLSCFFCFAGGIKEKLIGALTAGVKTVLLPAHNRKEVRELPEEVKNGLEIIYVR